MSFELTFAAIRRHPVSVLLTALLAVLTAALLGESAPYALAIWIVGTIVAFELWYAVEPLLLRRLGGCRPPSDAERLRLESALPRCDLQLLVAETGELGAARGLRCLVIGRDLLDLFEDRALGGFLNQVASQVNRSNVAGMVLIWLGNLPLLGAWLATRLLGQLARLLALVIGTSLVVPMVLWREGFLCWTGRLLASIIVGLLAASLLDGGFTAAGLLLMIAWLVVPVLQAIAAWESRRVERAADTATIAAGYGPQLLEATDLLALAQPAPEVGGLFSILCLPGQPIVERSIWIRRQLQGWPSID